MKLFLQLFRSKWIRTGQDALGDWPILYVHQRSGAIKLLVWHFTPSNYIWAMRRATALAFAIFACWCWIGYTVFATGQTTPQSTDGRFVACVVVFALFTIALPRFVTFRIMRRHPKRGRTLTTIRIKKGILICPNGQRSPIDAFHSAHHAAHPKALQEERKAATQTIRTTQGKIATADATLYRDSSCVQVRAGHRGSRVLCAVEFYNDPFGEYAGLASAAIDYAVMLAKDAQPLSSPAVVASILRIGRRQVIGREMRTMP